MAGDVGVIDVVLHERQVGDPLAPKAAVTPRGIGQCHVLRVGGNKGFQSGDVGTRIVVDVTLAMLDESRPHPFRHHVVGREDDPFGADAAEVGEQPAIPLIDVCRPHAGVVNKLGDDQVRASLQHLLLIVVVAAGGLGEIAAGVAAPPGLGD